jgi:hypothetical protein
MRFETVFFGLQSNSLAAVFLETIDQFLAFLPLQLLPENFGITTMSFGYQSINDSCFTCSWTANDNYDFFLHFKK